MVEEQTKKKNLFDVVTSIPNKVLIPAVVVIALLFYYVQVRELFNIKEVAGYIVVIILILFVLGVKETKESKSHYTKNECLNFLKQDLKSLQNKEDFPKGEIEFTGMVGSERLDNEILDYEFGFKVLDPNDGISQEYSAKVDASSGVVTDMVERREGFDGKNRSKLKTHPKFYEVYNLKKNDDKSD